MIPFLPVFENDPFLKYSPWEDSSNYMLRHSHEMAFMFVFYMVIHALAPGASKKLFGKNYSDLNLKGRINFDIHMVSMVQCVISITSLAPMWNHSYYQNRVEDAESSIFGYTSYGGLVASLAVGYFLWDVFVCIKYFESFGVGFLFHGVSAFYVFSTTMIPFCMPWIPAFLLFELSTPFVNMNFFASRLPAGAIPNNVVLINGILLLVTFFSVRILWGFYAVSLVATDLYRTLGMINVFFPICLLSINICLNSLNVFWFYKMLRIAKKKLGKGKPSEESAKAIAKEAAKIDEI
ncbi:topoisomerase I damage affected protein 4 [[Candida] jaroonii]|uniref:Topoisomerase I damage affected protein 4 n=1 Tax=[Candida] jaroonii TaxID=467808 RepID=A0ACA9Y4P3_9ASCO|nr:topoisomerase I damage affected protein 4 [[Candida] jaroonii]